MIARLGGYLDRAGDGEPGVQSLGIGLPRLLDVVRGWHLPRPETLPYE